MVEIRYQYNPPARQQGRRDISERCCAEKMKRHGKRKLNEDRANGNGRVPSSVMAKCQGMNTDAGVRHVPQTVGWRRSWPIG